jgi:hypothetical protein
MSDQLTKALSDPGPHTAESLAERLPGFPLEAIRSALDVLAQQGVLERVERPDASPEYRYVAPERYVQINQDVITNPGARHTRRRR